MHLHLAAAFAGDAFCVNHDSGCSGNSNKSHRMDENIGGKSTVSSAVADNCVSVFADSAPADAETALHRR